MPTPTPTPTLTSTPVTPTPTPTHTPAPTPTPDPRFGVVVHSEDQAGIQYFVGELGLDWYLNLKADGDQVPPGKNFVPHISEVRPGQLLSPAQVADLLDAVPTGSHWYVGGEPNDPVKFVSGSDFAACYYYYNEIKASDPTAKVMSPSLLNWWFTCYSCGGYVSGRQWTADFISAYQTSYGVKPPVDVWIVDLYPIDWRGFGASDPSVYLPNDNWQLMRDQIVGGTWDLVQIGGTFWAGPSTTYQGMRDYLDGQGYSDVPIWITEMAVHWGYDDIVSVSPPEPAGSYRWDDLSAFLNGLLDWLEANVATYKIEKWFLFTSWKNIAAPAVDGYAGIILFGPNTPTVGPVTGVTSRNCLGDVYRAHALDLDRVRCDAAGNTVPE